MPPASPSSIASGDTIKRRRITTACTTCRDRRVKCDRSRPACTQCRKGQKTCKYLDDDLGKMEFVNETRASVTRAERSTAILSDTWGSVIEYQVGLIKEANDKKDGVPTWAVAEAEEPSRTPASRIRRDAPISDFIPIGALGDTFLSTLTCQLPSREICQPFFENFTFSILPIMPICHLPTLQIQYDFFWENMSPSFSTESIALILAVLYTGAANSKVVDTENSSTLFRLHEEIFDKVDFASYHARNVPASIQLLQAYVIMNTFKASHLAPFSAFGFLPQVIRFAQLLRLHVDKKTGDPIELEVRRRIWWHLLFIDVESTIATGLPPIIYRSGYTTHLPSLFRDKMVSVSMDVSPHLRDLSPMMIAMQAHYQWAHKMQMWFEKLPSQDEVSDFKALISTLLDLIPDTKQTEDEWARTYLKMQIDRAYCMLGLRFWQLDQYKGTGCHSEVVQTARSFLNYYLHLSTLPASAHLFWFITGLIQPLHAVVILFMHLSTCTNITEEEHLSRNLLDHVASLRVNHIMNGSIVPTKALLRGDDRPQCANPRYLILVELRKRVWKKVGWDCDGRGLDPWAGRIVQGEVVCGGEEEVILERKELGPAGIGMTALEHVVQDLDGERAARKTTGHEELDSILAGDPLDMFQWDEWESLASEFFAS